MLMRLAALAFLFSAPALADADLTTRLQAEVERLRAELQEAHLKIAETIGLAACVPKQPPDAIAK